MTSRHYLISLLTGVLLTLLCTVLPCYASGYSGWKVYPAFNNEPVRIIDTPGAAYFFVLQSGVSKEAQYKRVRSAIFKHDYSDPGSGIRSIAGSMLHGDAYPALCDYSRRHGALFIVYTDGRAQILKDDGASITAESIPSLPGAAELTSLSFSGDEAIVATGFGIVCYDLRTARITSRIADEGKVTAAARCGDRILIVKDSRLFAAECQAGTRHKAQFSEVEFTEAPPVTRAMGVVPLNSTSVAVVEGDTGSQTIDIITLASDGWHRKNAVSTYLKLHGGESIVSGALEANIIPNRDGYLLYSGAEAFQLYASATASSAPEDMIRSTAITVDTPGALGSWDFSNFWKFRLPGSFSRGTNNGSAVEWVADNDALRPDAPPMLLTTEIAYSPLYGATAVSQGVTTVFNSSSPMISASMAALKNGHWTITTPNYNPPRAIENNSSLATSYIYRPYSFPTALPLGIAFDPVCPDYAFTGSWDAGVTAYNQADPKSDFLMFAQEGHSLRDFPGFHALIPALTSNPSLTVFSNVRFDGDGNMWAAYMNYDSFMDGGDCSELYYWKPDNRKAVLSSPAGTKAAEWGRIVVPSRKLGSTRYRLCALRHPANKNKIVTGIGINIFYILDHKGTLGDTSDDEYKFVNFVVPGNGSRIRTEKLSAICEDPLSGEVWLGVLDDLAAINPADNVSDGEMPCRRLCITDGIYPVNPFAGREIHDICFDDLNRMWVATETDGVWGISADRKSVVAHYTVSNSGLPSDRTYSLCWNPHDRSLLISTDGGFAEVHPEATGNTGTVGIPYIFPRVIDPSYAGDVMIAGVPPLEPMIVSDINGRHVATLRADNSGCAVWNLNMDDGTAVPTGSYIFTSPTSRFADTEITVVR